MRRLSNQMDIRLGTATGVDECEAAAVCLDDRARDVQAHSETVSLLREQRLEEVAPGGRRKTGSLIPYRQMHFRVGRGELGAHGASGRRGFDRVPHDVRNGLLEAQPVAADPLFVANV